VQASILVGIEIGFGVMRAWLFAVLAFLPPANVVLYAIENLAFLLEAFRAIRSAEPRARLVLVTHADAQAAAARLEAGAPAHIAPA
jgi:uncharacterized membrane protein